MIYFEILIGDFELPYDKESEENDETNMDKFANVGNHPHSSLKHLNKHDYDIAETSKYVLAYMSGFVVRKTYRFSNIQ